MMVSSDSLEQRTTPGRVDVDGSKADPKRKGVMRTKIGLRVASA